MGLPLKTKAAVGVIAILMAIGLFSCKFDADKWKADKRNRHSQLKYLLRSNVLIGKSYNQVYQLLGEEDISSRMYDTISNNPNFTIQYITGGCGAIDYERLLIHFADNTAVKAERGCN